jgi:phosphohistidine phosphatase
MDRLYLLRHGIAVPHGTEGYAEDDRPLTSQGERRVREIAKGLRELGLKVERIVTSPLPRAQRTAEIVADVLGLDDLLESADELSAGEDAPAIKRWLDTRPEARLVIVGHDPAFSDLVGLLATGKPEPICVLRKGGIAAFSDRGDGRLMLDWLARPRLLRRLRG